MFGMNAKDALGYMEDVAIIQASERAAEERDLIGHAKSEDQRRRSMMKTMEGVATFVAIKERDRRQDTLQCEKNAAMLLHNAASQTLEHVIRDFARSAGVSEDGLKKRYDIIRTQHYNHNVNASIERGNMDIDPRLNLSDFQKTWYVSGLDADHGF